MVNNSLYNGQNVAFTGGPYSNPYGLIQQAGKKKHGKTKNRKSKKNKSNKNKSRKNARGKK